MNNEILQLRKALVHYEECVDVCAAEHIMADALLNLSSKCKAVMKECNDQISKMLTAED